MRVLLFGFSVCVETSAWATVPRFVTFASTRVESEESEDDELDDEDDEDGDLALLVASNTPSTRLIVEDSSSRHKSLSDKSELLISSKSNRLAILYKIQNKKLRHLLPNLTASTTVIDIHHLQRYNERISMAMLTVSFVWLLM